MLMFLLQGHCDFLTNLEPVKPETLLEGTFSLLLNYCIIKIMECNERKQTIRNMSERMRLFFLVVSRK